MWKTAELWCFPTGRDWLTAPTDASLAELRMGLWMWQDSAAQRQMRFMTGKNAIPEAGSHLGISNVYTCKNLCELVKVSDAEVLMRYGEDFYQGYPVLTHKAFGKGHVYYVCADMELGFYQDFDGRGAAEAGLKSPIEIIPEGVSVTVRENEDTEYLFIQNYARKPQAVPVTAEYELLYGKESEVMAPMQTRILKKHK